MTIPEARPGATVLAAAGAALPAATPPTDVGALAASVAGREALAYVETGQIESAQKAAARWPALARLRSRFAVLDRGR